MSPTKPKLGPAPKLPTAAPAATPEVDAFVSAPTQTVNPAPAAPAPARKLLSLDADEPVKEQTQRLTLDIPISLHTFIKQFAVARRKQMTADVLGLLLERYSELGYQPPQKPQ